MARARWAEIDWVAKTWIIYDMTRKGPDAAAKEQREHVIPLSDWAVKEFEGLHRLADGSPWVLPTKDGKEHISPKQITRGVAKCVKRFASHGIGKFTPQDMRRTCRTNLSRLKVPYEIRRRVVNHRTVDDVDAVYDQWQFIKQQLDGLCINNLPVDTPFEQLREHPRRDWPSPWTHG